MPEFELPRIDDLEALKFQVINEFQTSGYGGYGEADAKTVNSQRVIRPGQIVSVDELQPGMMVEEVHDSDRFKAQELIGILAVGKRYKSVTSYGAELPILEDPRWMIVAEQKSDGRIVPSHRSLGDMGVIPHEGDDGQHWNQVNYLRYPQPDSQV